LNGLEMAGVDYWVYGGISIAAYVGEFRRMNKDVDVFVKESDFKKAKSILYELCNQNNFNLIYCKPSKTDDRPKINIEIDCKERFSAIPVYLKKDVIEFRYCKGNEEYSSHILSKVERNISGYRFITPPDSFIKEIFIKHLIARPDKKNRSNIKIDGKAIFTPEEYEKYILN
jgi:hypothetical protein